MRPQGYLLFAISVPNFILGSLILLRNIRDRVNIYFAGFALFVGLWAFGLAGFIFSQQASTAIWWAKGYYAAAATIAFAFLAFCISFTHNWRKIGNKHLILGLVPLLIILGMIFFAPGMLMHGIRYHDWGKEVILNKLGYSIFSLYFSAYVVAGFIILVRAFTKAKGVYRLHLKNVFVGLVVAFGLGATFNLIFPALGNYQYIWVGPLFTLVYVIIVSYTIVKHKLFDVRLIVARSLGYGLSIFTLSVLYGLLTFSVLNIFAFSAPSITYKQQLIYTILAVFSAFTFQPLKRFFDKITNRVFYRDAYDPQVLLDGLNKELVGNIEINKLLSKSAIIIGSTLKSEFCLFGIKETSNSRRRIIGDTAKNFSDEDIKEARRLTPQTHHKVFITDEIGEENTQLMQLLRKNDVAILVRLTDTPGKAVEGLGYLMLGSKKSGNPYSQQDKRILELIADEMVIAIQNALRFEEIENFAITMQEKVNDATRKLRQTNEKLKTLDETKDEFISMASHQLRTPLTSVKGYVSMVIEGDAGKITPMQKKLLDQAFISSQRMVYLIADLLNVSRLKTGKFIIDAKPTNLADVIEGEISQLVETAKGKNLTLNYEKPKDFPLLNLDETKVRQVVMNFADNAIYYTPAGGIIDIKLQDKAGTVEFTVSDNGIGVPKAEQHHMFSKFYRAGNARKARPDGTGLGLFMAKKVIVAQGGATIFRSTEGKGSTFGFSFPKAKLLSDMSVKKPTDSPS